MNLLNDIVRLFSQDADYYKTASRPSLPQLASIPAPGSISPSPVTPVYASAPAVPVELPPAKPHAPPTAPKPSQSHLLTNGIPSPTTYKIEVGMD